MKIKIYLTEQEAANGRLMAIQHRKSIEELIQETVSAILSGKAAWILLQPAPPAEVVHEVREAVGRIINKERTLIYVPDQIEGR